MQEDPHPGKLSIPGTVVNKYAYVLNNPINATDPSGQFIFLLAAAFVGGGLIQGAVTGDWSIGNLLLGGFKGLGLAAAFLGTAALVGGIQGAIGGTSVSVSGSSGALAGSGTLTFSPGISGAVAGLANPGLLGYGIAGAIGLPAAWGTFDSNAPAWTRVFRTIFSITGALGGLAVGGASLYHSSQGIPLSGSLSGELSYGGWLRASGTVNFSGLNSLQLHGFLSQYGYGVPSWVTSAGFGIAGGSLVPSL